MTEEEREDLKQEIVAEIRTIMALSFMKAAYNADMTLKRRTESGILPGGPDPLADLFLTLSNLSVYVKEIS